MQGARDIVGVLESLHARIEVLEGSMPKPGGRRDEYVPPREYANSLKLMRFRSPELYTLYIAFRTNKIHDTGHEGMWFINEHMSYNTLFGEGESKTNSNSFSILDTEHVSEEDELSAGLEKSKLKIDEDDIAMSISNTSTNRYLLSVFSYNGGIEKLESTFRGSLRQIIGRLNSKFS
jgi:hypothetical protein